MTIQPIRTTRTNRQIIRMGIFAIRRALFSGNADPAKVARVARALARYARDNGLVRSEAPERKGK